MPDVPNTPAEPDTPHAPYTNNTNVKDNDLKILTVVGMIAMSVLLIFGAAVYWSGLLEFPALAKDAGDRDYLNDTLVYRERRMALALVMRTFLTGFSFVVGLALCTMGGLFILRQVTSLTSLSGNVGGAGGNGAVRLMGAADASSKEVAERLQKTQFSFASYSPGVLFMLGGVVIMVVTQVLAIPVRAVEIVPNGAASLCEEPETGNYVTCAEGVTVPANDQVSGLDTAQTGATLLASAVSDDANDVPQTVNDVDNGGVTIATSTAILETAPAPETRARPNQLFLTPAALDAVSLPEGYAIAGFTLNEVLVAGPDANLTFSIYDLDLTAPDWGLTLP